MVTRRAEFVKQTCHKAMRGRIALLKHCVQNPLKTLAISSRIRRTSGVRARPRAALGLIDSTCLLDLRRPRPVFGERCLAPKGAALILKPGAAPQGFMGPKPSALKARFSFGASLIRSITPRSTRRIETRFQRLVCPTIRFLGRCPRLG